jgi:predicted TIM-barrel fold metal-dependent hydrolase
VIDMHVHYFPEPIFRAIWDYFETESRGLWAIHRKLFGAGLSDELARNGVERFTSLVYAHKVGLAAHLNEFVERAAADTPAIVPFGTIYAGDGECGVVARSLFEDRRFAGIKLHPFVSNEELDDVRFFDAYEVMEALGRVLVCHPGSGPVYAKTDGAARLRSVLERFPALRVVVAHCGAFEYGDYTRLADDFEHVYFDTAMNCVHTHVFVDNCPGREFFVRYQDRVVFGSDFPNIPYEYGDQVAAVRALGLGDEAEAKILRGNAERLLGLGIDEPRAA